MAVRKFLSNVLLVTADKLQKDQTKEQLQAATRTARRKLADWIQPEPEVKRPPIIGSVKAGDQVQTLVQLLPHTECGLFNIMAYAVDCGSWYKAAATREEALLLAENVIEEFAKQCHPWGDLWAHQLVHELAPNEGVNSYGEIDTFPFG